MNKLPIKLTKEPLVDVVFELRFKSVIPASNVLPGVLLSALETNAVERLPAADIPSQLRIAEMNMQFAPLVRVKWETYAILISDRSIAVGCEMPYPGWAKYKEAILRVLGIIKELTFIETVERYSMKYVDFLPSDSLAGQVQALNLDLRLGSHKLEKELFQARIEMPDRGFIKMLQVVAGATVLQSDGPNLQGAIVDVDIVKTVDNERLSSFIDAFPAQLDEIHNINKSTFFDCLRAETIESLGPIYE